MKLSSKCREKHSFPYLSFIERYADVRRVPESDYTGCLIVQYKSLYQKFLDSTWARSEGIESFRAFKSFILNLKNRWKCQKSIFLAKVSFMEKT